MLMEIFPPSIMLVTASRMGTTSVRVLSTVLMFRCVRFLNRRVRKMDDVSGSAWAVVRESEFLLRIFGRYPSFHDASVLSITMERACEAQILTSMLCLMTALFRRSAGAIKLEAYWSLI